jgi:SAM-dependent methyltransferase
LLRSRGLLPTSTLLDIGCGPLRAGIPFIRYLDTGNYFGFDYNMSFITAAERAVSEQGLAAKQPCLVALSDFELSGIRRTFDYALAFSVLNHCSPSQRRLFFSNISQCLAPGAKLFISHARWLKEEDVRRAGLIVGQRFEVRDLELSDYGWPPSEQRLVCPLYELVYHPG